MVLMSHQQSVCILKFILKKWKPSINYSAFDDDMLKRHFFGYQLPEKVEKNFSADIESADFIIVSPGINLKKAKLKKKLIENKDKIITDLDLFYLFNPGIKNDCSNGNEWKIYNLQDS